MSNDPFGGSGLEALLAQAQGQMQNLQQNMAGHTLEAEAGGGKVKAVVNGELELVSLKIDPAVVDPEDPGMLEDLVLTAVNRALTQMREHVSQEMTRGLFGGMKGLF